MAGVLATGLIGGAGRMWCHQSQSRGGRVEFTRRPGTPCPKKQTTASRRAAALAEGTRFTVALRTALAEVFLDPLNLKLMGGR